MNRSNIAAHGHNPARSRPPAWRSRRCGVRPGSVPAKGPTRRTGPLAIAALSFLLAGFAARADAQQALPIVVDDFTFLNGAAQLTRTVDLGTVPNRPRLEVVAIPDAMHPDAELEVELTNFGGLYVSPVTGFCYDPTSSYLAPAVTGPNEVGLNLWSCEPRVSTGFWNGKNVQALVHVVDPGANGYPLSVDVDIRGVTVVPYASHAFEVETHVAPQTVFLDATKDTVLYEANETRSNGAGEFLWAGSDHQLGLPPLIPPTWRRLNTLIAFDVASAVPFNAVITDAQMRLFAYELLAGGGPVSLYLGANHPTSTSWLEGAANASGTEFFGAVDPFDLGANWKYRRDTVYPWSTAGGDVQSGVLSTTVVNSLGTQWLGSSGLTAAVQFMVDQQSGNSGFVMTGPRNFGLPLDQGVRFASSEHGTPGSLRRPALRVDYAPAGPYSDGTFTTGTVTFIGEGTNFHWIYDLDQDDIYVTPIGGVCEALPLGEQTIMPYTYSYEGPPGFVGIDCCTWQIDSPQTGTTGVGEALFYHDTNPNTVPPDTDGDGIGDLCDNCVNVANGPFLGACVNGWGVPTGTVCVSDTDCSGDAICNLSQQDDDLDGVGNACPEPGFGLGLLVGVVLLASSGSHRFSQRNPC